MFSRRFLLSRRFCSAITSCLFSSLMVFSISSMLYVDGSPVGIFISGSSGSRRSLRSAAAFSALGFSGSGSWLKNFCAGVSSAVCSSSSSSSFSNADSSLAFTGSSADRGCTVPRSGS